MRLLGIRSMIPRILEGDAFLNVNAQNFPTVRYNPVTARKMFPKTIGPPTIKRIESKEES
jgi:hypothetical protein